MLGWLRQAAAKEPGYEIDVHGLPTWPLLVIGLVLDGVAVYVLVRAVQARRRGEDIGRAAASALRAVGPPALGMGLLIVALPLVAIILAVLFVIVLLSPIIGGDPAVEGLMAYISLAAFCIVGAVVTLVWWAVARSRRP